MFIEKHAYYRDKIVETKLCRELRLDLLTARIYQQDQNPDTRP